MEMYVIILLCLFLIVNIVVDFVCFDYFKFIIEIYISNKVILLLNELIIL